MATAREVEEYKYMPYMQVGVWLEDCTNTQTIGRLTPQRLKSSKLEKPSKCMGLWWRSKEEGATKVRRVKDGMGPSDRRARQNWRSDGLHFCAQQRVETVEIGKTRQR